jgi:outer membrane protein, heavy metal efflux system
VRIAELVVRRAQAALALARREPIPDLQLRAGLQQNRELSEFTNQPVGLQGFAEVGVQIPLFDRNQVNVAAARAEVERAQQDLTRVKLVLRERAASFVQSYETSRDAVARYKNEMIPRAQQAYEMYLQRYRQMAAAYPQVLIARVNWYSHCSCARMKRQERCWRQRS